MLSLSTFGIPPMRLRRIKNHLQALATDDALLTRENAGERLSVNELRDALEERGMYVPSPFASPTVATPSDTRSPPCL